jgi:DNA-binding response OmpR family regulator
MRILIVEDDVALAVFLERGLKLEGHECRVAPDGHAGLSLAVEGNYDLIVLDLSLPQKDGMQVLQEMRGHLVDASILVLTGRNALADRVRCLDLGADDFLLKPFSFSELTARCRALLRRRERFADPLLRHGDLELHRMERKVVRAGRTVELTVKEFALLEYLMLARGRTCSRSELLKEVWQMSPDAGTNVVDVYVNYLRKKLAVVPQAGASLAPGHTPGSPGSARSPERVIETVRGEGYSLWSGSGRPLRPINISTGDLKVDGFGSAVRPGRYDPRELASA